MATTTAITAATAAVSLGAGRPGAPGTQHWVTGRGTVVLLEEDHDLPIVTLTVSTRSGSLADPPGEEGLATLLAHMLRRGTRAHTSTQIEEEIDRLGGSFGTDAGYESIQLHGRVIRRNLDRFAALLGEMVTESSFPAPEVERARRQAIADLVESRDEDQSLVARYFRRFLFGTHPYARPSDGTVAGLEKIGRDDLVRAHRQAFSASNVVIAASGDLGREELERIVEQAFAGLFRGETRRAALEPPAEPRGRRLFLVDKPERSQTQIHVGHVGVPARDPDYFALLVGNTAFGGTFTARLMKAVRVDRGWSYGAYSRLERSRMPGEYYVWTFPAAHDAVPCLALEIQMLERLARDGLTAAEVDFAKSYLVNGFAFQVDTAQKRVGLALERELLDLPDDFFARFRERVQAVTARDVNAALRRHVHPDDLTIVVVATASELRHALEQGIPRLAGTTVVPFDSY